jgi:uncharacterized protein
VRVVFDTNSYISALVFPAGNAETAYVEAIRGRFELYTSVAILTETAKVLQMKFEWEEERIRQAIQEISQIANVLRPRPTLHILKDEPDNRILECAVVAQAQRIVSGDRHLLSIRRYGDCEIISLADFLAELDA